LTASFYVILQIFLNFLNAASRTVSLIQMFHVVFFVCSVSYVIPCGFSSTHQKIAESIHHFIKSYAQGIPVTAEAIKKIIDAAGVADVEAFWPGFFAKTASGIDIKGLLSSVGSGAGAGPAAAAPAAAPAAAAGGKAAAPAAKAKAPEPEPEEEESAGFSLFD
jgi:ribosomal protein L12E/L44/L45/RPP1/RPP2